MVTRVRAVGLAVVGGLVAMGREVVAVVVGTVGSAVVVAGSEAVVVDSAVAVVVEATAVVDVVAAVPPSASGDVVFPEQALSSRTAKARMVQKKRFIGVKPPFTVYTIKVALFSYGLQDFFAKK